MKLSVYIFICFLYSVLKFMISGTTSILKSKIFQTCAAIYQLLLHMVFTSRHIRGRKCQKYFYVTHWQKKILDIFDFFIFIHFHYMKMLISGTTSILKSKIFQTCAAIYQLLLHMVFTSRNWFAMQGPVAIEEILQI
jgi:hypothetical protein